MERGVNVILATILVSVTYIKEDLNLRELWLTGNTLISVLHIRHFLISNALYIVGIPNLHGKSNCRTVVTPFMWIANYATRNFAAKAKVIYQSCLE